MGTVESKPSSDGGAKAEFPSLGWVDVEAIDERLASNLGLPAQFHFDPAIAELENRYIWKHAWQPMAAIVDVREPGDFLTIQAGRLPIVVVRDQDNELRAFLNVCTHRAGPVAELPAGNCKTFQCRYHGWTFGLDGTLKGAPGWKDGKLPPFEELGLRELALDTWAGIIFVSPDPIESLADSLGGLPALAESIGYRQPFLDPELEFAGQWIWEPEANWKLFSQQSMECYHCATTHADSLSPLFKIDAESFDARTFDRGNWIATSFRDSIRGVIGIEPEERLKSHVESSGELPFQQFFSWPNTFTSVGIGTGIMVGRVNPTSHNRTTVTARFYTRPAESDMQKWVDDWLNDRTLTEDVEMIGKVQRGIESSLIDPGPQLVDREATVLAFERLYWDQMRPAFGS